jgi:4-amino-4-deoxy-L-arabinose transferase-like glycosyltransferase
MFVLIIALYGLIFLLPFAGSANLFDWDEIIFAESAREMIITGDYLTVTINFEPFWEKPPLFIWLQVISMKIFGINEFAARFPNIIGGIITLVSIYLVGRKVHDTKFGMLWALAFGCSVLPFFYFRTGIIDPWFNLFIFNGIAFFIFYLVPDRFPRRYMNVALSAFFLGLAVLTKGPVAVLIFLLTFLIYLVSVRGRIQVRPLHVVSFIIILAVTGGFWFLLAILNGNMEVVRDFILYQAGLFSEDFAGHSGFPGFHFVILLFGVYPASVLMLNGFQKKRESDYLAQKFRTWMYILLFLVLILFSIVQTKLVHYSSLAYYPVTFLAAWVSCQWMQRNIEIKKWQVVFLGIISAILVSVTTLIPLLLKDPSILLEKYSDRLSPYVKGVLSTDAGWGIADLLPAAVLMAGTIIAVFLINRRDWRGVLFMYATTLLFTFLSMALFVPKVEHMIQRTAIDFMKVHQEKDADVITLGFKSYAPLFYGEWKQGDVPQEIDENWLDKRSEKQTIYVVMKADNSEKVFQKYPGLMKLDEKNGYVFAIYRRESSIPLKE